MSTLSCSVSLQRRERLQMAAARLKASLMSLSGTSDQLYTLGDGVTGHVNGEVCLAALLSLKSLLELDEMSVDEFSQASKSGYSSDMVVLGPDNELNSSSLLDDTVIDSTKAALSARSESSFLKNPSIPFTLWFRNFETWYVIIDRLYYLPIGAYVMKLTWLLEPNTALHGSGLYQRNNVKSLTNLRIG